LAFACQHCNNCKYDKLESVDPLSNKLIPLFHPRKQDWIDHFTWSKNYLHVIGISAIGRATVNCLKVNRQEAINLRAALVAYGAHPPK